METDPGFIAALEEAKKGYAEGGVPIGAALVSKDGEILGRGHNMRVQKGSATLHVSHIECYWPCRLWAV
jgi:cytosine deaminase